MRQWITVSRIRFWHYLVGPWLVGVAIAAPSPDVFARWEFWAGMAYWAFPANVLVYGVNDIADGDTDQHNPKKEGYESRLSPHRTRPLLGLIMLTNAPIGLWLARTQSWQLLLVWGLWLVLSMGYSLPPVRAKARPFVDGVSNALYYLPGVMAYLWAGGTQLSPLMIVAAQAWVMAMHAYSAVPDIDADTRAGLRTTATTMGARGTLVYCGALWLLATVLTWPFLGWLGVVGTVVYAGFCALNLHAVWGVAPEPAQSAVRHYYTCFPGLNFVVGMALFWYFYTPLAAQVIDGWSAFLFFFAA